MKNPLRSSASSNLGMLLVRLPVGVFFVCVAIMKFRMGVGNFVQMSMEPALKFMPDTLARGYLHALPVVEILIGTLFILGLFTRTAALIASLILISIMIAVTGFWQNSAPHSNVIFLGVTLLLMLAGPGSIALDNVRISKGRESIA
jgi:uncharacterized membrane protein YphA (DoxX/SURF4 family)